LRVAGRSSFAPAGEGFDPTPLLRKPVRTLRGGPDGIAVAFAWRAGALEVTVLARGALAPDDLARAFDAARGLAAIDDDPAPFLAMASAHPRLAELARRHDVRIARTPTLFESFAAAVVEQLVTSYEAWAATRRLWAFAGELITGTRLRAAPTAKAVRDVPMWRLHAMGIASRRAITLHLGARRGAALERLRELPGDVVVKKLTSLRGVGPWTANLVARNALGWADAVPVGDLHAPRLVTEALTGTPDGDDEAMLAALEPFRPHRARVCRLVEQSSMLARTGPVPRVDAHRRMPWRY
jgi:3-methyladenine DNA glycosylase/8-oxoguanine DNA glycosylase